MKKSILFLSIIASLVACKKAETTGNQHSSDSTSVTQIHETDQASEVAKADSISHLPEIKKSLEKNVEPLTKKVKSIDSLSNAISKTELKSETKTEKIDSVKKEPEKTVQINVTPTKVVKETKVIYKNQQKPEPKISKNLMQKNATMEISVDDVSSAKETAKYEIRKYDGVIKTENLQTNDDMQLVYLKAKVPMQKFEYLVDDLTSQNIGKVENKNIEVFGNNYAENTWCDIELTLYNKNSAKAIAGSSVENDTFGGKTMSAIASGWKVLENIFLFLLPFWPLFLIGGFAYFYYKDKKNKKTETLEND